MTEQRRGHSAGSGVRRRDGYRLVDATLDGTLDEWPPEPPRPPKTAVEAARLQLIATPRQVHRLSWQFSDVGRASAMASSFRRAKPSRLSPTATGTFDARAFFDPTEHKWRIAARYLPPDTDDNHTHSHSHGGGGGGGGGAA